MIRKIALCAVLVLILVPAFAMAAGPQGQGSGAAQGNGIQQTASQEQVASQLQVMNQVQLSNQLQNNGEEQMFQNRICSQECEMSTVMAKNQSQMQFRSATGAENSVQQQNQTRGMTWDRIQNRTHLQDGSCGNCQDGNTLLSASADQQQDQTRGMTWDRIRGRLHLQDGSCGNCLNG